MSTIRPTTAAVTPAPTNKWQRWKTTATKFFGGGRGGGGAAYLSQSRRNEALSILKTRELQLASEGRYKGYLLTKMVTLLKKEFLEDKERRLTVNQLLQAIKEPYVSEDMKKWLGDELPNDPRIRVVEIPNAVSELRYAYKPPIEKLKNDQDLLKLLKSMHSNGEGGLLRPLVENSLVLADIHIQYLLKRDRIIQINRCDMKQVLFYKDHREFEKNKLNVDTKFTEVWRNIDISQKNISQIKHHLRNQRIPYIQDDEEIDKLHEQEIFRDSDDEEEDNTVSPTSGSEPVSKGKGNETAKVTSSKRSTRKRKRKSQALEPSSSNAGSTDPTPSSSSKRKRGKIRDNAHVLDQLKHYEDFNDETPVTDDTPDEPEPSTSSVPTTEPMMID